MKQSRDRRGRDPDLESEAAPSEESSSVSRRSFLQTLGIGATAASLPAADALAAKGPGAVRTGADDWGPDAVPVRLRVNGETLSMRLEPRVTLLDAIRNHIQIDTQEVADVTGPKRVCDRSSCGACTVMLDGEIVYACGVLAIETQGREITTVEGLSDGAKLHPVQEEFVECDGSQCGFCTPGFVMAAVALLGENSSPSKDEIRRGLDGNICRCGTQPNAAKAVENAAARMRGGR